MAIRAEDRTERVWITSAGTECASEESARINDQMERLTEHAKLVLAGFCATRADEAKVAAFCMRPSVREILNEDITPSTELEGARARITDLEALVDLLKKEMAVVSVAKLEGALEIIGDLRKQLGERETKIHLLERDLSTLREQLASWEKWAEKLRARLRELAEFRGLQ